MALRNIICSFFLWVITQSVVWADTPRATILLYHGLTNNCPGSMYEKRIDRFYNDMMYIKENFDVVSLPELQNIIENKIPLSRNTVVITFDDGMLSKYTMAVPILKELNLPATFFIVGSFPNNDDWFMTWEQINDLSKVTDKDGKYLFTIGSHSYSHDWPGLQDLTGDALKFQLEESKRLIDMAISPRVCETFAVPFGILPPDETGFRNLAAELGYKVIRTSEMNNISVETANLLNLPCLPLYDFTEPGYIGAFNQSPTPLLTPFFEPAQDASSKISPYTFDIPITDIISYLTWNSQNITVKATTEDHALVENIEVIHEAPWDVATIRITTKEGASGEAKINIELSEPGTYPSSGYFYINVESPVSAILHRRNPNAVYVYPNPATDYIEIMNADTHIRYSIHNIFGQSLKTGQGNKIEVGFLPKGVYIIIIEAGKETSHVKFVKN